MKKILLALALFFGLASVGVAAEKGGKKYNVKDLVDARVCSELSIDANVCLFSSVAVPILDTTYGEYLKGYLKAKKAGNMHKANEIAVSLSELLVGITRHLLKACAIWDKTSYKGRRFLFDSVVYTNLVGEDKPLWDSQEERILECEWAEDVLGVTR